MEYRLAQTDAERDAAFELTRACALAGHEAERAAGIPGCASGDMAHAMVRQLDLLRDKIAWVIAVDEQGIAACIACLLHQEADVHLTVFAQGTVPERFTRTLYHNLVVGITRAITWPGCCGNRWSVVMPLNPLVDVLDAVTGPVTIEDTSLPGVKRINGTMDAPGEFIGD